MNILVLIGIAVLLIILGEYNSFVRMKKKVKQERATIDVYLNQRFDLIPNLVECVKAYTKHESETFEKITTMRTEYMNTKDLEKAEILNNECNKLVAILEKYPELKASEQFLALQQRLSKIESQLQAARRLYNGVATKYNTKISVIPNNIFAKIFGFKEEKLFIIKEAEKINDVKIEL